MSCSWSTPARAWRRSTKRWPSACAVIDKPVVLRRQQMRLARAGAARRRVLHRSATATLIPVSASRIAARTELLKRIGRDAAAGRRRAAAGRGRTSKLAIVGRRNTGKSTFINALAQSERMIVSEVPGTTRDSVDVRFERDGKVFIAIDTAGVRRKSTTKTDIEFYS